MLHLCIFLSCIFFYGREPSCILFYQLSSCIILSWLRAYPGHVYSFMYLDVGHVPICLWLCVFSRFLFFIIYLLSASCFVRPYVYICVLVVRVAFSSHIGPYIISFWAPILFICVVVIWVAYFVHLDHFIYKLCPTLPPVSNDPTRFFWKFFYYSFFSSNGFGWKTGSLQLVSEL
jgi:hypothetical protein